jgi:NADPH:quinone reductase-like Zn-dependent oxidoreductase
MSITTALRAGLPKPAAAGSPLSVDKTFPLAAIAEAHRISEHGRVRGRLVLAVS